MKYFSSLVIILLFSLQSFSQKKWPGYIVMNNGDTLRGTIKRTSPFNDKPAFTLYDNNNKAQKIMETEAQAFGWLKDNVQEDYTKFKVSYPLQPYSFLKLISKGKYLVFETYIWVGDHKRVEFYFKSADGNIMVFDFSDRFNKKNTLKEIFADCPTVVEQIKGYVTEEKVMKWIDEYNNCVLNKVN
jgi:hypothetical protein